MRKGMVIFTICLFVATGFLQSATSLNISVTKNIIVPDDYPAIQEAVDAAIDGDAIFIKSGVYKESKININKSLTITGEDNKNTILDGEYRSRIIFIVCANDVIIENLHFINADDYAIKIEANNIVIHNNIFNKTDGIGVYDDDYSKFQNIQINNNLFNQGKCAIWAIGIENIVFSNNSLTEVANIESKICRCCNFWRCSYVSCYNNKVINSANWVQNDEVNAEVFLIADAKNAVISNNIIENNGGIAIDFDGESAEIINNSISNITSTHHTIFIDNNFMNSSIVKISNNIITNVEGQGIDGYFENTIITNNKLSNCDFGIMLFEEARNNTINHNKIINCRNTGIDLGEASNNEISYNHIENNDKGITLLYDSNQNSILNNNLINNNLNAYFIGSNNKWDGNYYDKARYLPQLIFGKTILGNFQIPWINIDWHPAKEPYDIT